MVDQLGFPITIEKARRLEGSGPRLLHLLLLADLGSALQSADFAVVSLPQREAESLLVR